MYSCWERTAFSRKFQARLFAVVEREKIAEPLESKRRKMIPNFSFSVVSNVDLRVLLNREISNNTLHHFTVTDSRVLMANIA